MWIETKIKYDKTLDTGAIKTVNEPYLVDALSFAEAEARITKEMQAYISGEFSVSAVAKRNYTEMIHGADADDRWWKVKVAIITINEKTGTEKRTYQNWLVQAESLERALTYTKETIKGTVFDYDIVSIAETKIMDVFEYEAAKTE